MLAVTVPAPFNAAKVCAVPSESVLPPATVTWANVPSAVALFTFRVTAPPVLAMLTMVPSTRLVAAVASVTVLAAVPLFWKVRVRGAMA